MWTSILLGGSNGRRRLREMIEFILTIVGGAGGLLGIIKFIVASRRQARSEQIAFEERKELASREQLIQYQKALNEVKGEAHISPVKIKFLWGLWEYVGERIKVIRTDTANHDRSIGMFIIISTYCIAVLLCFIDGDIPVSTLNPNEVPNTKTILYGLYTQSKVDAETYILSLASIGLLLLTPLNFAICQWITGAGLHALRRK